MKMIEDSAARVELSR